MANKLGNKILVANLVPNLQKKNSYSLLFDKTIFETMNIDFNVDKYVVLICVKKKSPLA